MQGKWFAPFGYGKIMLIMLQDYYVPNTKILQPRNVTGLQYLTHKHYYNL